MAEQLIEVDGEIRLCVETFGSPDDPPVLLIAGIGSSMLWWDEDLCSSLADRGRFVVRYDHRDTGRSTSYPVGRPGYTGDDLTGDAARVLDGLGLGSAHVVGVSAGGGIAQELAVGGPERVRSLVLISTTPFTAGERDLPGPTEAFGAFVGSASVDWDDRSSVVEYLLGYQRLLAGGRRRFDGDAQRSMIERDVERTDDIRTVQNHDLAAGDGEGVDGSLSSISVPTLVVHGTADPMFPPEHGESLAAEIPDARLLLLDGAGHGVFAEDHDVLVAAIAQHTAT